MWTWHSMTLCSSKLPSGSRDCNLECTDITFLLLHTWDTSIRRKIQNTRSSPRIQRLIYDQHFACCFHVTKLPDMFAFLCLSVESLNPQPQLYYNALSRSHKGSLFKSMHFCSCRAQISFMEPFPSAWSVTSVSLHFPSRIWKLEMLLWSGPYHQIPWLWARQPLYLKTFPASLSCVITKPLVKLLCHHGSLPFWWAGYLSCLHELMVSCGCIFLDQLHVILFGFITACLPEVFFAIHCPDDVHRQQFRDVSKMVNFQKKIGAFLLFFF